MKKSLVLILVLFILIGSSIGCGKGEALGSELLLEDDLNGIDLDAISHYEIDVQMFEKEKMYTGRQYTRYTNNTGVELQELYFHLYPNAYKTLEGAPIILQNGFPDPMSYDVGYIDVLEVSIDGFDLEYEVIGEDKTILKVKLNEPLTEGETIKLFLGYDGKLPNSKDRFGYGQRVMNFGNWYPILCVYDEDGWNLEPYYKLGDPFYSNLANYNVRITTDKKNIVASSGNILSEEVFQDKKIYEIEGKLIRDFAWALSPYFKIKESKVDNTTIRLYYLDEKSTTVRYALNAATDSIKTFNKRFGKYPYKDFNVVMTEFSSGMEYPGIVFISNDYFNYGSRDVLEQIIVHEAAHQWWYGLVGSNQIKEAWLDEALATYSEVIYASEVHGKNKGREYYNKYISQGFEYGKRYLGENEMVNRPLNEFVGWNDYSILVYLKGAMFINQIKVNYGEDALYRILSEYYKKYKFYNASTEDFIKISEEITESSFKRLVDTWLN